VILQRPSFERAYHKLNPQQQARVGAAIGRLETAFGYPHLHAGLRLRPIGHFYEFRAGLQLRVLFVVREADLVLVTVGHHNHIARFIRDHA
jgi:mRNA-degrading endonuclease RelE of RelBE toxin-antitoxin system